MQAVILHELQLLRCGPIVNKHKIFYSKYQKQTLTDGWRRNAFFKSWLMPMPLPAAICDAACNISVRVSNFIEGDELAITSKRELKDTVVI